ncbi:hypothetical protein CPB86DRAFT_875434 [Serendipita vermifera]|nr:hypothetical protein CPB86DRAFT_875434 [Serendipita vermifera]
MAVDSAQRLMSWLNSVLQESSQFLGSSTMEHLSDSDEAEFTDDEYDSTSQSDTDRSDYYDVDEDEDGDYEYEGESSEEESVQS